MKRIQVPTTSAWLALFCAIFLLVYRLPLDSDRLFFDDLFSSIAAGTSFSDWKLPPAPGYVPDLALYWIGFKLLPTAAYRLFFVSAMQAIICCIAALWFAKVVRPPLRPAAQSFIVGVLALSIIVSARSEMWLFVNSNNVHVGATLFGLLSVGAAIRFARSGTFKWLVAIVLIGAIATPSTAIYTVFVALPGGIFLVAMAIVMRGQAGARNKLVMVMSAILLGQIAGLLVHKAVTFHDPLKYRLPMSPEGAGSSFVWFIKDVIALGHGTTGAIYAALFAAAILLLAAYCISNIKLLSDGPDIHRLSILIESSLAVAAIFTMFVFVVGFAGSILSGGLDGEGALRYFAFPITLVFVLAIIALTDKASIRVASAASVVFSGFLIVFAVSTYYTLRLQSNGITPALALSHGSGTLPSKYLENEVAACIKKLTNEGTPLKSGISFYWLARAVSYRMPGHPIFPVTGSLDPMFWMMDTSPLTRADFQKRFYNFAIVQDTSTGSDFSPETGAKVLPQNAQIFICSSGKAQIWYYGSDALDIRVKTKIRDFVTGPFYN